MPRLPEHLRSKPVEEQATALMQERLGPIAAQNPAVKALVVDALTPDEPPARPTDEEVFPAGLPAFETIISSEPARWQPDAALVEKLGMASDPAVIYLRNGSTIEGGPVAPEDQLRGSESFTLGEAGSVEPPDECPFAEEPATSTALVPLAEQLTESEETLAQIEVPRRLVEAVMAERLEAALGQAEEQRQRAERAATIVSGRVPTILEQMRDDLPWSNWAAPQFAKGELHSFHVAPDEEQLMLCADKPLGVVTPIALEELGRRVTFPCEFVQKLPADIAAQVINARIEAAGNVEMLALFEEERWTNILPAHRGVFTAREAAEVCHNTLAEFYPTITVSFANRINGAAHVRLLTPVAYPVTPAVGDVLQMGIDLRHQYGGLLSVTLYVERLACLNGMTANQQAFSWKKKEESDAVSQRYWLEQGVRLAIGRYTELVERAQRMAATFFEGSPEQALRERAAMLGFPARRLQALLDAFNNEAGNTEWHLLNAFTRLGTHGGLDADLARQLQNAAGEWTLNFEEVTARLPRPVANRVGARIIEETVEA